MHNISRIKKDFRAIEKALDVETAGHLAQADRLEKAGHVNCREFTESMKRNVWLDIVDNFVYQEPNTEVIMSSALDYKDYAQKTVNAFEIDIRFIKERAEALDCSAAEIIHAMCETLRKEIYL